MYISQHDAENISSQMFLTRNSGTSEDFHKRVNTDKEIR